MGEGIFQMQPSSKQTRVFCIWIGPYSYYPYLACFYLYYAKDNFRTPMIISIIAVILNIMLNYLFVFLLNFRHQHCYYLQV